MSAALEPMVTYGTNPGHGRADQPSACPTRPGDEIRASGRRWKKPWPIWISSPAHPLLGHPVDVVFIGSCTNGRMTDLRQAAGAAARSQSGRWRRVLVVPGSESVRRQAEAEGLDRVFKEAGAEWRFAGCRCALP